MVPTAGNPKARGLIALYELFSDAAIAMGGRVSRYTKALAIPLKIAGEPHTEEVDVLRVELGDDFRADLAPGLPLCVASDVVVLAKRLHRGVVEKDWKFVLEPGGWRYGQTRLVDEDIRKCLTPDTHQKT